MSISLAMIVRNEGHCIRRCLESVAALVDEMVVVDTGSSDGTVEVAESCGAQVHPFTWNDSFADARNAALGHCSGDWVLQLDADEAIDEGWHEGIRELTSDYPSVWCWCLRIFNVMETQPVVHYVSRLFRRLPEVTYDGRIHETVDRSGANLGMESRVTNATITHWGYDNEETRIRKARRNLELHRLDIATGSPPTGTWYYMYRTMAQLGDMRAAAEYLDLALADPGQLGVGQRAELLIRKYQAVGVGNPDLARHYLDLALRLAPNQIIGRVLRAQALAKAGAFCDARDVLDVARAVAKGEVYGDLTGDVALDLSTIERWQSELGEKAWDAVVAQSS